MISSATKRSILRVFHLVVTIPVLGFVYGDPAQVQQYVNGPRYIFVPALILSGYWMYAGAVFAIIGVAAWLGTFRLSGIWTCSPESDRSLHRAKDLADDSGATVKGIVSRLDKFDDETTGSEKEEIAKIQLR